MLTMSLTAIAKKIHLSTLLIVFIFFLGFFLRFNQLSNIPNGLYADETAIGYNAYSILMTGKDEHGAIFPMYFRSFDDYKLPVYIYSTALAIKAFGANAFAVRFTSTLFGALTIIALHFLIYELSKKRMLAILASFFIAVNPWHTFFSRVGYEVNLATALLVIGMLCFIAAINRKNNLFLFLFSIIAFLLSLYTYNVTRIISPLIFASLIFLYYKQITINSKKLLVSLFVLFFIGMLPFFITFIPLQSQPGFASQKDALIIGTVQKAEILQTRSYFVFLPEIFQKIFLNYWVLVAWKFLGNIVSFFSTGFFFMIGADHPHENIGGFGMFYYFDLPLILFGTYQGLKKKVSYLYPFYLWFLFMLFIGSIIVAIPNNDAFGTRTYAVVIPLIVFSAFGLYSFIEIVMRLKNRLIKTSIAASLIVLIGYSCLFYFTSYFFRFPIEYAKEWGSEDQKTVQYVSSIAKNYKTIVFDDSTGFIYTSLLFYGQYSPQAHQQQAVYKPSGLVIDVSKDGKYEFRKIDWNNELKNKGTLFITGPGNTPANKKPLATFSYPTRPVVIFYDRKIAQYPTTETAYEIFESGKN
jgi:4-amino-4-deoxy-L-arabinose transferase-like glycosyltransferase